MNNNINPWDVQVEAQTVQDVFCTNCNLEFPDVDVAWYTTGEGVAECPNCELGINVLPPEQEIDCEREVWL